MTVPDHFVYYAQDPARPDKTKAISIYEYFSKYKKMVNATLANSFGESYRLTHDLRPSLSGGMVMGLEFCTNAFCFCVYETMGNNGETIQRNALHLGGHSVGSFCHWVFQCERATNAVYERGGVRMYISQLNKVMQRNDVWTGQYEKSGYRNSPAIYLVFEYGVFQNESAYGTATAQLDNNDILEKIGMDDIPLSDGMFRPFEQGGNNSRILTHNCICAPFVSILGAAVWVTDAEMAHAVYMHGEL